MIQRTTIVSFESGKETAEFFTSSPAWMNCLDDLSETRSDCFIVTDVVKDPDGHVVGKHYSFPQKFITLNPNL